jgi:hypothetical protein
MSEATYFFEHPFWSLTLIDLCRPEISDHVKNLVRTAIREQASAFIADFQNDKGPAVEWFAEEMLQVGQKIPRAEHVLHFDGLVEAHQEFVANSTSDWERNRAGRMDLKSDLARLSETGVLLQGFEVKCQHCKSQFWYHIDDVKAVVDCLGCRRRIPLPVERPWSYKPNELLWKSIRYYGLVPVIRAIRRLFDETETSLNVASGIIIYEYQKDPPNIVGEADLAWIRDGVFGIAEVKQTAGSFKTKDCDRLIRIASATRPDTVLLVAVDGEDASLARWQRIIEDNLRSYGIATESWGPSAFLKRSHHVW